MGKATELKNIEISKLKPYENNAKIHGRKQIDLLKKSIEEFGFVSPCLIDGEYNVIAGHGRITAAKEMGLTEVPCLFIEGLTETQRKAYILADNKLTEIGTWDMDLVNDEIESLKVSGFETDILGFEFDEEDFKDTDFGDINKETMVREIGSLKDKFLIPPISFIETQTDYWQDREKKWSLLIPPLSIFDVPKGYWQKRKKEWTEKINNDSDGRKHMEFEED